eukprot:8754514-Alexandrium_andersonii.AAC.1
MRQLGATQITMAANCGAMKRCDPGGSHSLCTASSPALTKRGRRGVLPPGDARARRWYPL